MILTISEKYNEYAEKVLNILNNSDIRGFIDTRNEKVGKKIRDAEIQKTPFMLIIGEKEMETNSISVRQRGVGDIGTMQVEDFEKLVKKLIDEELSDTKLETSLNS